MHKDHNTAKIEDVIKIITDQTLNSISFDDAVVKTYFFHKIASILRVPTIYFDFDLLYSGYVASSILQKNDSIEIIHAPSEHIKEIIVSALEKVSVQKHLVIFDSLNGLYTALDRKDAGRLINSIIMLLVSVGQQTGSIVLVGSISKFREGQGWVLSALGRRILEMEKMSIISVRRQEPYFQLTLSDRNNTTKSSIQFDLDLM